MLALPRMATPQFLAGNTDAPYEGGERTEMEIVLNRRYPLVTIASMAIANASSALETIEMNCEKHFRFPLG